MWKPCKNYLVTIKKAIEYGTYKTYAFCKHVKCSWHLSNTTSTFLGINNNCIIKYNIDKKIQVFTHIPYTIEQKITIRWINTKGEIQQIKRRLVGMGRTERERQLLRERQMLPARLLGWGYGIFAYDRVEPVDVISGVVNSAFGAVSI